MIKIETRSTRKGKEADKLFSTTITAKKETIMSEKTFLSSYRMSEKNIPSIIQKFTDCFIEFIPDDQGRLFQIRSDSFNGLYFEDFLEDDEGKNYEEEENGNFGCLLTFPEESRPDFWRTIQKSFPSWKFEKLETKPKKKEIIRKA